MDEVMFEQGMIERAAASVEYPSTPQLRARVLARIAETPVEAKGRARAATPAWALPALAAAASLAVATGAALAVPGSRDAIADFFGIEGSRVEPLPTSAPGTTPTPFPPAQDIDAGATPSTLAAAAAAAGFEPALPRDLPPKTVYTSAYGAATGVILRYDAFDLWELRTAGAYDAFVKGVPEGATITDLAVSGAPARWISGGSHIVQFVEGDGTRPREGARVVDRSTLIWRTEYALYRMETVLPLEDALAIAASLP